MQVVVNDSCILIDLAKLNLLESFLKLPFQFLVPDLLFRIELKSLNTREKELIQTYCQIISLDSKKMMQSYAYHNQYKPKLSEFDCIALCLAETIQNAILLTGDERLRKVAINHAIEIHGLLWILDEIEKHKILSYSALETILLEIKTRREIRLPVHEIEIRLKKYQEII